MFYIFPSRNGESEAQEDMLEMNQCENSEEKAARPSGTPGQEAVTLEEPRSFPKPQFPYV